MGKIFEKLFSKNKNTTGLYVILIIGIVVLVAGSSLFGTRNTKESKSPQSESQVLLPTEQTQEELSQILSQIRGAGEVSVMITYEGTGEKQFAADTSTETSTLSDQTGSGSGTKTENSLKEEITTIIPGNEPVLTKEIYPKVRGVVVVAQGAADPVVKQDLISAVKSILDVPDHKIGVFIKQ